MDIVLRGGEAPRLVYIKECTSNGAGMRSYRSTGLKLAPYVSGNITVKQA